MMLGGVYAHNSVHFKARPLHHGMSSRRTPSLPLSTVCSKAFEYSAKECGPDEMQVLKTERRVGPPTASLQPSKLSWHADKSGARRSRRLQVPSVSYKLAEGCAMQPLHQRSFQASGHSEVAD